MSNLMQPSFNASEQVVLEEIECRLRARGWAAHVTVEALLQKWGRLAVSVDQHMMEVEDYTNDLMGRDGLEIVLAECREPLRSKLKLYIEEADKEFLARTQEDVGQTLERYSSIPEESGWWWRRRPAAGPLANFLTNRQ